MKNIQLQEYLQSQIATTPTRLKGIVNDFEGKPLFKRTIFTTLQSYLDNKGGDPRIIVMPGLRGTGKTTLLSQLYLSIKSENVTKLYLSVEEAIIRYDVDLWEIIENYEILIGKSLEELDEPLYLFLDEIHYDKKWAIFLKTLYDRSKKVKIFCTGSAAILLREQINADVARRVFFVDIDPVSFCEYMLFKHGKTPLSHEAKMISDAILRSDDAELVFKSLQKVKSKVDKYWLDISKFEIQKYIKFGTFPFTLRSENEAVALTFISQIISKVIYTDIPQFHPFNIETLSLVDKILYLISDTLGISVSKLSETLEIKPDTLRLILKSLILSGLVIRVAPHGSHFRQVKKPSKYLFATPSLRYSYLASKDNVITFDNYQGSLLEDLVGMYLGKLLSSDTGSSITYDMAGGGADFVISLANQKIVIEVGTGVKDYKQIIQTSLKIKSKYNLIISSAELEYSKEFNAVKIPLKYLLIT
jgi:predicted AAA+ superfamily ATPase